MTYLADVNVWIALTNPAHQHRVVASEWLSESAPDPIVFCRTTQKGLLRLLTNRHVMGVNLLTAEGAWDVYDDLFKTGRVRFASEPSGLERAWREATRHPHAGPNFWTDAYLAGVRDRCWIHRGHIRSGVQASQGRKASPVGVSALLDLENFFFLGLRRRVDLADVGVGHLLHIVQSAALFVFADGFVLEQFLQMLVGVAADVAREPRDGLRPRRAAA